MKISKGIWIGLIVIIFFICGTTAVAKFCNWNLVCNGAAKSGWGCQLTGAIFFVPAVITIFTLGDSLGRLLQFLNIPQQSVFVIFIAIILGAGALFGWIIEKCFPKAGIVRLTIYIVTAFSLLCCLVTLGNTLYHL